MAQKSQLFSGSDRLSPKIVTVKEKVTLFCAFALGFCVPFIPSCDHCRTVDCAVGDLITVQFISKSDSSDLIKAGVLSALNPRISSLSATGTTSLLTPIAFSSENSNFLSFNILRNVRGFELLYADGAVDTLLFTTHIEESECCGEGIVLDLAVLGTDTLLPRPDGSYNHVKIVK